MLETLNRVYELHVLTIKELSKRCFLIHTKDKDYVLKKCENQKIEAIHQSIDTLHLDYFVRLKPTIHQRFVFTFNQELYYLMDYIPKDDVSLKELKLKFYFEMLVYLHQKTFYHIHKDEANMDGLLKDIETIIDQRSLFYESLVHKSEINPYRSPSEWMLVLNNYRYFKRLEDAKYYLNQYKSCIQNKDLIRVSFVYMNYDEDHICLHQKKILSIDKMMIHIPIYDLFYLFQKIPEGLFDLESLSFHYLNQMTLFDDEKFLLATLLSIVPYIHFSEEQIDNVIRLSRLNYYLEASKHIIETLLNPQ